MKKSPNCFSVGHEVKAMKLQFLTGNQSTPTHKHDNPALLSKPEVGPNTLYALLMQDGAAGTMLTMLVSRVRALHLGSEMVLPGSDFHKQHTVLRAHWEAKAPALLTGGYLALPLRKVEPCVSATLEQHE